MVLNFTAFNSSNDTSHRVSVILMNNDQFTSSNDSYTQMSVVMEIIVTNSSGEVVINNNPSINLLFEYQLENLMNYFNISDKSQLNFEQKKKYLQCKYYDKIQKAWIQTGNVTSASIVNINGVDIVRVNCQVDHLTSFIGGVQAVVPSKRFRAGSMIMELPILCIGLLLISLLVLF